MRPRRLEFGVELLVRRARERSAREGVPLPAALAELYERTRVAVDKRVALMAACALSPPEPAAPPRFLCDGSLGGLARWLRAAGYEAESRAGVPAETLLPEAARRGSTFVTTDSGVLRRRDVSAGAVDVVWVPSSLKRLEQLGMVLRDLGLPLRTPRCMGCGAGLRPVPKDAVLERIPPRTRAWKDEYFVCEGCGALLWQGTHWERIARGLATRSSPSA